MHIALAPAHDTLYAAEVAARTQQHAVAPGAAPCLLADEGSIDIPPFLQVHTLTRGDGLVPAADEHSAVYLAGFVQRGKLGVERSRQFHGAVGPQRSLLQLISVHVFIIPPRIT